MYIAYVDDSGQPGRHSLAAGYLALGVVIIDACEWQKTFAATTEFRKHLAADLGWPKAVELKANWLVHGKGGAKPLRLPHSARKDIYHQALRLLDEEKAKVFTVVIYPKLLANADPLKIAWALALERIGHLAREADTSFVLFHDEGEEKKIMKVAQTVRDHGPAGVMSQLNSRTGVPIADDTTPRKSQHSDFVQLADLVAYAGAHHVLLHKKPTPPKYMITPQTWLELGNATISGGSRALKPHHGIVSWKA